jgi:hypothetical protein
LYQKLADKVYFELAGKQIESEGGAEREGKEGKE